MIKLNYSVELKCGKSKKKTEDLQLMFGNIRTHPDGYWMYDVATKGMDDSHLEDQIARSEFECIVLGLAYLRQSMRYIVEENPKIKFFFETDGELEETSIEDIFWVHDCLPD